MSHIVDLVSMDSRLAKKFGAALKRRRLSTGMTQEELAHASTLDRTYISLLERGIRQPSLSTIYSLSESLNTDPWILVKDIENSPK